MCVVYDRLSCKMKHIAFDFFLQLEFRGGGVITSFRYTCIFMCVMCVCVCHSPLGRLKKSSLEIDLCIYIFLSFPLV